MFNGLMMWHGKHIPCTLFVMLSRVAESLLEADVLGSIPQIKSFCLLIPNLGYKYRSHLLCIFMPFFLSTTCFLLPLLTNNYVFY